MITDLSKVSPQSIRDEHLGKWSSHPYWQRRRTFWMVLASTTPLLIVLVVGAFLALDIGTWLSLIAGIPDFFAAVLIGLGCITTVAMQLALTAKWGQLQAAKVVETTPSLDEVESGRWVGLFVLVVILCAVVPQVAVRISILPPAVKFLLHLLAVFPAMVVLITIGLLDTRRKKRSRAICGLLRIGSLIVGSLLVLTLVYDFADAAQNSSVTQAIGRCIPFYPRLQSRFLGLLSLGPVLIFLTLFLNLWRAVMARNDGRDEAKISTEGNKDKQSDRDSASPQPGDAPATAEVPPGIPPPRQPPEWVAELLTNLPGGCRMLGNVKEIELKAGSPPAEGSEIRPLLGELVPTQDQDAVFRRFMEAYEEMIENGDGIPPLSGSDVVAPADMVLHGEAGVGKTTVLAACALYAAFVRGQHVLFIVPSPLQEKHVERLVTSFLQRLGLHYFARPGILANGELDRWLTSDDLLPRVIISTVDKVERLLYGASFEEPKKAEKLACFVRLLEVVMVDDFMDIDEIQRAHLPFLLDKQRLILASEFLPIQVVVTCPPLAKVGESIFGSRLFTEKGLHLSRNVLALRPRIGVKGWHLRLEAGAAGEALESLALWCLEHRLRVVVYQKGLDVETTDAQRRLLRQKASQGELAVIADLNQPVDETIIGGVDAVFYEVAAHEDVCLGLRMNLGGEDSVIISFQPDHVGREEIEPGIVPVVADRTAKPLAMAHLQSIQRLVRPRVPIPADPWIRLGFHPNDVELGKYRDLPLSELLWDAWTEESYGQELWPWISVWRSGNTQSWVTPDVMPRPAVDFYRRPGQQLLFLGKPEELAEPDLEKGPPAFWCSRAGAELGAPAIDLTYFREARLRYGDQMLVLEYIHRKPGRLEFRTEHWRGRGIHSYLPVWDLGWSWPGTGTANPLGGSEDFGIRWVEFTAEAGSWVQVHAAIKGRMNDYGTITPEQSIHHNYLAFLSAVLVRPQQLDPDRISMETSKVLAGGWKTADRERFWPALTAALVYALEVRTPGLTFYARPLAFQLRGQGSWVGDAIFWFLEPLSSGRAVMPVLGRILETPEERRRLFLAMQWFLTKLKKSQNPLRFVHYMSRMSYFGIDHIDRIDEALSLVSHVIARSDVQEEMIRSTPPVVDPSQRTRRILIPYRESPLPEWDESAEVTPWEECVHLLWHCGQRKQADLDTLDLGQWENRLHFLIQCSSGLLAHWDELADQATSAGKIRCRLVEGAMDITAEDGVVGRDFARSCTTFLQERFGAISPKIPCTLKLTLWALPRVQDTGKRTPQLRDPINTSLMGGLNIRGLIFAQITEVPPTPPPPPEPDLIAPPIEIPLPAPGPSPSSDSEWLQSLAPSHKLRCGAGKRHFSWDFRGKTYEITWDFESSSDRDSYLTLLQSFRSRISHPPYSGYLVNDPYLDAVHALGDELLHQYGGKADAAFAEFLLAFIQSIPYVHDPSQAKGDWPHFPSEYFLNNGGDCEDSSLALFVLLLKHGFDAVLLNMPSHMAVGVAGPYSGTHYMDGGRPYYYAETATDGGYTPLGEDTDLTGSATPDRFAYGNLPSVSTVKILNAEWVSTGSLRIRCALVSGLLLGAPLRITASARKANEDHEKATASIIASLELKPQNAENQFISFDLPVDESKLPLGSIQVDLAAWSGQKRVGCWIGAVSMQRSYS